MAARGAGAGAHQGDMDRRALAAKERSIELAHREAQARLEQNDSQFKMNLGQRQSEQAESVRRYDSSVEMTEEQNKYQRGRNEQIDSLNVEQKQYERGRFDRLDSQNEQKASFDQERAKKSDGWAEVLNELTAEQKQQQLEQNSLTLNAYREASALEKENRSKRETLAKSHFGALLTSAIENGGIAPVSALDLYMKNTGSKLKGLYFTKDGGAVVDEEGDDGKVASNFVPQQITNAAMEFVTGILSKSSGGGGGRSLATPDIAQGKFDLQRGESLLKNLERRIDALKEDLKEYPDPEIEKKIKEEIKNLRKRHDDVSNEVYGKDSIDDDKGGDKGGGKVPTFVNPVVERLYGMSGVDFSDRLRKIARAENQTPDAILFGILKGETEENKNAFFKSLK